MKTLSIDIETYSSYNLKKCGLYKYVESPDFEILLFSYSVDDSDVITIDLAIGEAIPTEIINAIKNPEMLKWAFNAQFERICLSRYLNMYLSPKSWRCSMVWGATLSLPFSLDSVSEVLNLKNKKLKSGKELIKYFSVPCRPTIKNKGRTRNLPYHDLDKWELFKEYNKRDVEAELEIKHRLARFPMNEAEWNNYILDQEINDRGIKLDMDFVSKAIACDEIFREHQLDKSGELTGLSNPNSIAQLKEWLIRNKVPCDSLTKASVEELISTTDGKVHEVLKLRQELSKSSVKKYNSMENVVCKDQRAHGLIQFYGASRTGRYAGRLIQVQNLPQNKLKEIETVRELIKSKNYDAVELLYDSVQGVLSELIRTAFVPEDNHKFYVVDFSAIEARVIAWLAGETWRNEVFKTHGKIYEASASHMFNIPLNEINKELRQKGKIAELALGYGGSVGALTSMGSLKMGLKEEELHPLVNAWRSTNPNIVNLWRNVNQAAMKSIKEKKLIKLANLDFNYQNGILFIKLPSDRNLVYLKPEISVNRFGSNSITFRGITDTKKWGLIETYGAKLVENIVQGISRDILAESMMRLSLEGYKIVMHCHDEVVIESEEASIAEIIRIMTISPDWAKSLILKAEGYECDFYKKD